MSVLSHGQLIALTHHLADYPEDVAFETIIDMIEYGDEGISVWVYFEDWHRQTFTDHLKKLAHSIDKAVIESKNEEAA